MTPIRSGAIGAAIHFRRQTNKQKGTNVNSPSDRHSRTREHRLQTASHSGRPSARAEEMHTGFKSLRDGALVWLAALLRPHGRDLPSPTLAPTPCVVSNLPPCVGAQPRVDARVAEERRAPRGKHTKSSNGNANAIRATEDAAPGSFVAGALRRAGKRAVLGLLSVTIGLLLIASPAQAAFGLNSLDITFTGAKGESLEHAAAPPSGEVLEHAGAHPFEMTTSFRVNGNETPEGGFLVDEEVRDAIVSVMEGFAGAPTATPTCSTADFLTLTSTTRAFLSNCPDAAAVGYVAIQLSNPIVQSTGFAAVYNLQPSPGEVAKFGFWLQSVPVTIDARVSESSPYQVVAGPTNISQLVDVAAAQLTLWGVPGDERHDPLRGRCIGLEGESLGTCHVSITERPFLTMPRACRGPLTSTYFASSWRGSTTVGSTLTHDNFGNPQGMVGCGALPFGPEISSQPTSKAATSPTGLDFGLDVADEGLTSAKEGALAGSDIERVEVTLPEGMSINPSQAEGLAVCSEADVDRETSQSEFGVGCPAASKIGAVEVETPLLEDKLLKGSLFVSTPYENPEHSLIAFYIVIKDPELGIDIVQPAKVTPNPVTGQLVTTTEAMPQLPFSHFRLHFKEGTRSPLVTPQACGSYNVAATLYPYSGGAPVTSSSLFQIISGPGAGPCPSGGTPPFHPGLIAGTINNAAGSYSPFDVRLFRNDSEQEITHFSIKLPPGVVGKIAGIPFCPDAAIAAAKAREGTPHGGTEELDQPSCPAASQIGTTLAGAGVGPSLTYVPGKVYMAGPYHGSNLSIVAITAAKAGPFDLGTVVIREALKVSPETAEVSVDAAGSDPLPHIIAGIPVHLRDIRVYVDRPGFVLNPTSCEPTSTASTVLGSGTNFATEADDRPVTVTTRFQAADCASLGFKPRIKLMLKGPTKRTGLPRLKAVVRPRPGDANIGRAVVTLPRSEFLEQGHIKTVCTRVQFNAGGGNGEQCPKGSIYGRAKAWTPLLSEPLTGHVFLRSNGGERRLPDLVASLHSKLIDINLLGFIRSLHPKGTNYSRIRTIFASVPDAPVSRFRLEMFGGKKSLLINSTNLCKGRHRAISTFVGQNGKRSETRPAVQVRCKRKGKKHRKSHGHSRHTRRADVRLVVHRHGDR